MRTPLNIIWLHQDLRLTDNPALYHGGKSDCLVLFTAEGVDSDAMGAASRVFLHHALASLRGELSDQYQVSLIIRRAGLEEVLDELAPVCQVAKVFWNQSYEPRLRSRQKAIEVKLRSRHIQSCICPGAVLYDPMPLKNKSGQPFKVFTPFYRHIRSLPQPEQPLPKPKKLMSPRLPGFDYGRVEDLRLLPVAPRWDIPMMTGWQPSEKGALVQLKKFAKLDLNAYPVQRDIPSAAGTSRQSPYLHFGLISPRTVWAVCQHDPSTGSEIFLRQMIWREFAIYSLFHQPQMATTSILGKFANFPWTNNPEHIRAWQMGQTGYPLVDAGMRELWHTGWMHNRTRMIVGSFLVKNLNVDWRHGAAWFWQTLVDADQANNSMGWQWVSGCGIDPSPFFRIFNPMLQAKKFDPMGVYTRRWVPQLQNLPDKYLQTPWDAPASVLKEAGIRLGQDYPRPLVDFAESRLLALMLYDRIKG